MMMLHPHIQRAGKLALSLLPLAFVLYACWQYGVPYFKDSNETFHSYLHGWNLVFGDSLKHAFVTDHGLQGPPCPYTHNPNFPRYVHAALLSIGISDVRIHVLAISIACALLTALFILRLFPGSPAGPLVLLFFALDWMGLQYLTNTYRAFSYPLFWGSLLAMRRPLHAAMAFFILFQFEYAFAAFVAMTALLSTDRWDSRIWAIGGACASVILFGTQVYFALGMDGMAEEFLATAARRGWSAIGLPLFYGPLVLGACAAALIVAALRRREAYLYRLYLSMAVAGVVVSIVFAGYVSDAYLRHGLPFVTFFVATGFAVLASFIALRWSFTWVVLTIPLALNSHRNWAQFPPLSSEYLYAVRQHNELVFTDGPIYGAGFAANPTKRLRDDGYLYLCLKRPWLGLQCTPRREPHENEVVLMQSADYYISARPGSDKPKLAHCRG